MSGLYSLSGNALNLVSKTPSISGAMIKAISKTDTISGKVMDWQMDHRYKTNANAGVNIVNNNENYKASVLSSKDALE